MNLILQSLTTQDESKRGFSCGPGCRAVGRVGIEDCSTSYKKHLLQEATVGFKWFLARIRDRVSDKAEHLGTEFTSAPIAEDSNLKAPSWTPWRSSISLGKVAGYITSKYDRLFRHREWNVGIVNRPIQSFLEAGATSEVRWFPPPKRGTYLADPFALAMDGALYVFCEEFDYRTRRGVISSIELLGNAYSGPRPAITLPVHMSYPCVFEHRGQVFCVPETSGAREAALYKAEVFPHHWAKAATLLRGFAAVDSTVFKHEGRWWLMCTDKDTDPDRNLFAWYARDLLGPWHPHENNPIKRDLTSSRPAGTPFHQDGSLYRPGQDNSRIYGGRIVINRVKELTRSRFEEVPAAVIEPFRNTRYPEGIHTISGVGGITLVDGFRFTCIKSMFNRALKEELAEMRNYHRTL